MGGCIDDGGVVGIERGDERGDETTEEGPTTALGDITGVEGGCGSPVIGSGEFNRGLCPGGKPVFAALGGLDKSASYKI